ncbi:DeoR/GlpR family DNA-binding transcription regulator [Tropicimonas sp. TH_r6]|uniref:DeoR/GlpR family DNA-binding transcription regulator n=1 Tax=Tropicimonas sp. TH_r6 TaxID=3082085 RepID=UPI002954D70D|nr:DeoR/GlpR family DNA-binding transcription regulator [Tropicimonas sp. TH_r6]MDV7143416.1 DeoR/GlpR family DNA-binding transcription regulator [Tropicimonas sp. TH_r6]
MDSSLNTPETRQQRLRERVADGEALILTKLAAEFDVSIDTIRRDLLALEAEGKVQRVRGGALPVAPPSVPVMERLDCGRATGDRLARAALPLVEDGMVLMLDGGTSVLQLARALPPLPRALVVTPAPAVALETLARGTETILIGGRLSRFGGLAVGQAAVTAIADIAADLCVLGACGIEAGFGLSADDPDEAALRQAMAQTSARVSVLTGAVKLGRRARHRVRPCSELDLLITDAEAALTAPLAETGLEIVHA